MLEENTNPSFSYLKGSLLMLTGVLVVLIGGWIFPDANYSLGSVLFPFVLFVLGAVLCYKGFSDSPIEILIRGGADKIIKYARDKWFKESIEMIIGTKWKWYRATFFFPMIFTFVTIGMLVNGIISATFFPNIQPDFFNIEAAYNPGDNKKQTQHFVETATRILLEENDRIKRENGDSLMTYFSSNIGFSSNLGQAGNHTGSLSVFVDAERSKTPLDTLMNRINRRLNSIPEGRLAQDVYVGGFNRFGKEIELGLTSTNESNLLEARTKMKKMMAELEGPINIKDNMPPGRNEITIKMKTQAEMYGISKGEVLSQIRQGFFGQEAQRVIIGTD